MCFKEFKKAEIRRVFKEKNEGEKELSRVKIVHFPTD